MSTEVVGSGGIEAAIRADLVTCGVTDESVREEFAVAIGKSYLDARERLLRRVEVDKQCEGFPLMRLAYAPCEREECGNPHCTLQLNGVALDENWARFVKTCVKKEQPLSLPSMWQRVKDVEATHPESEIVEGLFPGLLQLLDTLSAENQALFRSVFPEIEKEQRVYNVAEEIGRTLLGLVQAKAGPKRGEG